MNRVLFSFTLLICIAGVAFSSPAPEPFPDDGTSDLNFKSILDLLQDKMVNTEEEENHATMEEDYANVVSCNAITHNYWLILMEHYNTIGGCKETQVSKCL